MRKLTRILIDVHPSNTHIRGEHTFLTTDVGSAHKQIQSIESRDNEGLARIGGWETPCSTVLTIFRFY
eukprot:5519697-Pyramimonas_sp.AAC.3